MGENRTRDRLRAQRRDSQRSREARAKIQAPSGESFSLGEAAEQYRTLKGEALLIEQLYADAARRAGVSWYRIGLALGESPGVLQRRWGP